MLIDTHTHLDYAEFAPDFSEVLSRAKAAGVTRMIGIATGLSSTRRLLELAGDHSEILVAAGVHPNNVDDEPDDFATELRRLAASSKVVAIGETGLDYYRMEPGPAFEANKLRQTRFFREQLKLAAELSLNVVIHQRAAWDDTISILSEYDGRFCAVFHCFGETMERAEQVIAMGHLVSFTGIATFKNGENVRAVARHLAAGQFMVETDCPYLAPVPFRGKRCEPAHTRQVAEVLAETRGETLLDFAAHTTSTAEAFFKIPNA